MPKSGSGRRERVKGMGVVECLGPEWVRRVDGFVVAWVPKDET